MPEISREIVALLSYLLPGFLVAWLFYALTSHPKPAQLERVIQALIFTLIVNALVVLERFLLEGVGRWWSFRVWDRESELVASVLTAITIGFAFAYFANKDILHGFLRRFGVSQRTSMPNEWCTVFAPSEQYIVVHLKDDRRLFGWPSVWPSDPEKGHIFVTRPSWVHGPTPEELSGTEGILVNVNDIAHIEFVAKPQENHGHQTTATTAVAATTETER